MNWKQCKHHLLLTLFLAVAVFGILIVTMQISSVLEYALIQSGVIPAVDAEALSQRKIIVLIVVGSIAVGTVLAWLLNEYPLHPLNRIVSQMNRLASGDFKARLEFDRKMRAYPMIQTVTESFNKMAEELEKTEMLRSDFINNFSHEFKTPIVSIAGFAKLLKRGNLTDAQKAEYVSIIEEESLRLAAMATNVLNLTKVENQTILTDTTSFNLSEQIRNSILLLEEKWTKKQIELHIDFDEHMICANEELLKQIWINLLDNAIKFSPEGGSAAVTVNETDKTITVTVSNTGSEIPPEKQERIFNKFYQADESHASEGNGIGLALVQRITALHNGTVSVSCEHQVTTFTVTLPKDGKAEQTDKSESYLPFAF